jgi:hypothetical protein
MAISAKPKPGYRFIRWEITPLGSSTDNISASEIYFTPIKNTHFRAVFEPYTIDGPVVVINEINYHSSDTADAADWIELYNRVPDAIDISGWILKDEKDDHSFEIPENIYLPVDGYRVICEDSTRFDRQFPTIHDRTGNFSFGLGNSGDCIRLYNATMDFVDSVHYSDEAPWPYTADGYGNTLSLIAPYLSNDLPQSWSGKYMLTPGDTNIMKPVVVPVSTSGLSDALNQNSWLEQNYPNPCAGNTTISYGLSSTGEVSLVIYDLYGRIIKSLVNEYQGPNGYKVSFNVESMAAGTYFYTLRVNHIMIQTRMMVVY